MKRLSRRYILKLLSLIGLIAGSGILFKKFFTGPHSITTVETQTLFALLDTLIPSDETPGAIELGVGEKILAKAKTNSKYVKLIIKGCKWLDDRAGDRGANSFTALNETERENVLTLASSGKTKPVWGVFITKILYDAFYYYYSHPDTWSGLKYPGPPQPMGFMDYASPPEEKKT